MQLRRVLDGMYPSRTVGRRERSHSALTRADQAPDHRLFVHCDTQGNAPGTKWVATNAIIEHRDWIRPVMAGTQRFACGLDDNALNMRALELVPTA